MRNRWLISAAKVINLSGADGQYYAEYSNGPRAEQNQKKLEERLLNSQSILDLVYDGLLGQIDYNTLTMEAFHNDDMHPFGDLGHFFAPRAFGHMQAIFQHTAQIPDCDANNVDELTFGESEARRQVEIAIKAINKYLPGYEKAYLTRVTLAMRTREGRHMLGDYQLAADDVINCTKFDDVIAKGMMHVHVGGPFHSAANPGTAMSNMGEFIYPNGFGSYDIPYRSMVPQKVEGMLITGKCLSMSEDFKRDLLPDNMIWGQAAGVAAALCARDSISPRQLEVDISELQEILKKQGAILDGTH